MIRSLPSEHDEKKNAEAPNVTSGIITLTFENFGSNEIGRVTRCHEEPIFGSKLFGKAKVTNAQRVRISSVIGVKNVGGLEIAVNNLTLESSLLHL